MASFVFKFALLSVCVALLQVAAGQNAPEIFVAPTAMHVDYGSTAYMACVAYIGTESQSSIVTTMNWYDPHSGLLTDNSDGSVTVTTTMTTQGGQVFIKSILKLCNFTTINFGSYTCRVTNIYGQNERNWIVSIVQLPLTPQLLTSPNSITTTAGNTIYMTCSAYGYPYPSIIWRKDNQVVQSDGVAVTIDSRLTNYNGAKVSVSTLKICGADSDNVGSYTCTASVRDIGQVTSSAWRLDVPPVPIISNAPNDHTISYGVTAYMTCTAYLGTQGQRADSLTSTLAWTGPGNAALTNRSDGTVSVYAERVVQNGQVFMKSYLKICNFTQSNSGQYGCRISNTNGADTQTWTATLPYAVALPQLVAVPSTQTVREGNTVYMTCAAYGYPFPDVTWYKNGQPIVSGDDLFTISSNVVNYNGAQVVQSDLRICLTAVQDSGSYSCSFTTRDFGTISSTPVTLTVLPVPEIFIAPESQLVNYGVTFFMTCAAHIGNTAQNVGQLGTTVTWMGPGSEALTNSTTGVTVYTDTTTSQAGHVVVRSVIQICGFTQALQGLYSCQVSNANGQDIKMWNNTLPRNPTSPTVVASPTTRSVSEGNSVFMVCAGYGYPIPVVTWYRNNQPLDPNVAGRVTITNRIANYNGALVAESTMKICGAGEEDHGSYYCSFSSAFGNPVNSNTWQVNVNPAPTIVVAPTNNQVEVGNTVFMSCAAYVGTQAQGADSITTTFTWLGPDSTAISSSTEMEVLTDTSIQGGRVFVRSILKVCRFSQQNVGRYTCRVSNANGVENRTWTTIFPQTPSIPQLAAVSAYDSVTLGKTVYFACAMYGYPQPQISWTKDGAALPSSATVTTNVITINNLNVTQSVVRVCGFQSVNIGLYQCLGTNTLGNALGYIQVTPEAPEVVVSPPSTEVNYANSIFMSCIVYVGRLNRSVDQLQTTLSWLDRNNNQLVNRSDGSVSVFTDSFNQNGLLFLRSILQICNFTTSDTGMHSCRAMNSNGQGSANWNLTFTRSPLAPFFLVTPSTSPITAAYGRTFYIRCAAYGFPPPQVTWSKDGQAINTSSPFNRVIIDTSVTNYLGAQVSQSILRICGVGEEDIGAYVCTARTNVFDTSISTLPVMLGVSAVPTIVISPMDQDVTFGKTTLMSCVAFVGLTSQNAASIPTTISWWNPSSQQLVNNSDNSVTVYPRTLTRGRKVFAESILKICNVSHALEGRYACQVSNNNGLETRYWNVSIPQQPFAPSIVAIPVLQSTRRYGFSVLMACAAYGYPPPVISFTQRGQPIDQADLDGPFKVKNSVQTYLGGVDVALGVLEVCSFDYDDVGMYACTATARNVGSVMSQSWNVDILPAPFIVDSPRSQNVSYDTVLRMTCSAALGQSTDTPPDTTMTWYDGSGMVMDSNSPGVTITTTMSTNNMIIYLNSTAVVSDIGLQHFGQLRCTANNSLGWDSATWNISSTEEYFPPQGISLDGNSRTVSCGTTPVTLTCNVWGYPPPDVVWTLNGTNIDTSNQRDTLGFNYTTSQLVINGFSLPNAGVYVCTTSNDVGNAKSEPVVLSLDTEVVLETAAPSITSNIRTSSDLAVVQFKPVGSTSGQEFVVSYYAVANSSGTPDLSQLVRDGSVQSAQTQITLTGLQTCSSYWVTVAVVNSCGVRRSGQSDPKLIGLYDTRTFELLVTLTTKTCTTWITENANGKISDLTTRLRLAASTCGITIPCIVSSQWQCQNDDAYIARFSTTLVGDAQTPTGSIASCINKWFTDNGGIMNLPIGNVSYAVGLVPESGTGPQVNGATIGIVVVVVIAVVVGIVVAAIIAVVVFRSRKTRKPAKKERLEEPQEDFSEVYSRHSFAVVENPLFADQEEGDDTYAGGAEGYEYDSGTLEKKEDLGADDDEDDDKAFI